MSLRQEQIVIRNVYATNLHYELSLIHKYLPLYPIASFDTEFPGVIFTSDNVNTQYNSKLSPSDTYLLMKTNVDALKIIQLGLTLCDYAGNLPDLGTLTFGFVWQFNFQDFDIESDSYNPESIALLQNQGIDFLRNKKEGIPSWVFKMLVLDSGLLFNGSVPITWITFHSCYDFGFLIKILTGRELPVYLDDFKALVAEFFGTRVYDMKQMMQFCNGVYGGLEKLAKTLNVARVAGKPHQAGSDSLLILHTFVKFTSVYRHNLDLRAFQGALFGLEDRVSIKRRTSKISSQR